MAVEARNPRDLRWSQSEKKIARAAFDTALARDISARDNVVLESFQSSLATQEVIYVADH